VLVSFLAHLVILGGIALYTGRRAQKPVLDRVYTVKMVQLPVRELTGSPKPSSALIPPAEEEKKKVASSKPPTPVKEEKKKVAPTRPRTTPLSGKKEGGSPASPGTSKKAEQGNSQNVEGEGLRLDVASFPFPDYLYSLKSKIEKNWHVPYTGTSFGSGRATVFFQILRDGRISRAFVEDRSGVMAFDQAALSAVTKSAPLPPLPEKFPGDQLGVHFLFEYEE